MFLNSRLFIKLAMASPTTNPKRIALITGSTRAIRIGPKVTSFIHSILSTSFTSPYTLEVVDIAAFSLPVFNESVIPANVPKFASFAHAHSIAWSSKVAEFDGYVLVTACYNAGPPGGIKNALDYLFNEIKGKPCMIMR